MVAYGTLKEGRPLKNGTVICGIGGLIEPGFTSESKPSATESKVRELDVDLDVPCGYSGSLAHYKMNAL